MTDNGVIYNLKVDTDIEEIEVSESVIDYFAESDEVIVRDISHEYYQGVYDVTPKTYSQKLETAEKVMKQDVNVKSIPFFEFSKKKGTTSNSQGYATKNYLYNSEGSGRFYGAIQRMALWNKCLSSDEIATLFEEETTGSGVYLNSNGTRSEASAR